VCGSPNVILKTITINTSGTNADIAPMSIIAVSDFTLYVSGDHIRITRYGVRYVVEEIQAVLNEPV
jgi:hypothetical protein